MQKHLKFVISNEFLILRLKWIVPLNKLQCFDPTEIPTLASKLWTLYCVMPRTVHI